jgi:hypothetical protein
VSVYYADSLLSPLSVQNIAADGDVIDTYRPNTVNQYRYAQEYGELSPWQDRAGLGAVAVGHYGTDYLPRVLAMRLASSAGSAADMLVWAHLLLAGLAATALARLYGIGPWSAALVGTSYALSHLAVRWAPFFHSPAYFLAFPLALLGLELIWRGRALRGVPLLGLGIGIAGVGSVLLFTFFLLQALGLVALYRFMTAERRERARPLLFSTVGVFVGLLVALPGVLPFVLEQRTSIRQQVGLDQVYGMDWSSVLSTVDPVGGLTFLNADLYLGLAAPLLLVGLAVSLRRRALAVLPLLVGLSVLLAFKTPLLTALMLTVPGWNTLSNAQRLSFVMVLPLAISIGLGLDWVLARRRPAVALVGGGLLVTLLVAVWVMRMAKENVLSTALVIAAVVAVATLVLAGLIGALTAQRVNVAVVIPVSLVILTVIAAHEERRLGWIPARDTPPRLAHQWLPMVERQDDPQGRWMSHCQELGFQSSGKRYPYRPVQFLEARGRWLDNYESFVPDAYYAYWRALTRSGRYDDWPYGQWNQHSPEDPRPSSRLVNAAGIGRVLGSARCAREAEGLGWQELARRGRFRVYENPSAYPMAYVSHHWERVPGRRSALHELTARRGAFASHTDFVEGGPQSPREGSMPAMSAKVRRVSAERVLVEPPRVQRTGGLLVLLDAYHVGWRAYSEGAELPVVRVNGMFRGVALEPGVRVVTFAFEPWWKDTLPLVSSAVALVLLIVLLVSVRPAPALSGADAAASDVTAAYRRRPASP